jgi:hypothetical protein
VERKERLVSLGWDSESQLMSIKTVKERAGGIPKKRMSSGKMGNSHNMQISYCYNPWYFLLK